MGGSGGDFFTSKPEELSKKIREAEDKSTNVGFETEVSGYISKLLSKYNDRDKDSIQLHLDAIKLALHQEIEGTLDLFFGGSVAKHTYVDGISDIDALVILNNSELKDLGPKEVKDYFYNRLKERFPNTDIEVGKLAVTIKFQDTEIQILPAIEHKDGYKISNSSGEKWSYIEPKIFAEKLTNINKELNGKVIPTIKVIKSIVSEQPENKQLRGYHTEALAVEIFKSYSGELKTKSLLKYFFEEASKKVLNLVKDSTGQSVHVDMYLGESNSLERMVISDTLGRIGRKIKNADGAQSINQWHEILGGE